MLEKILLLTLSFIVFYLSYGVSKDNELKIRNVTIYCLKKLSKKEFIDFKMGMSVSFFVLGISFIILAFEFSFYVTKIYSFVTILVFINILRLSIKYIYLR